VGDGLRLDGGGCNIARVADGAHQTLIEFKRVEGIGYAKRC